MIELPQITDVNGRKFSAKIIEIGDNYGLNGCLVNEKEPMIEIYDDHNLGRFGQFVSRYYVSTFMQTESGIDLHGGVPEWKITAGVVDTWQAEIINSGVTY